MEKKNDRAKDAKLRRAAVRLGLCLKKSRLRLDSLDNFGGYMLLNAGTNSVVCGSRFDMTTEHVASWLAASARDQKLSKLASSLEHLS